MRYKQEWRGRVRVSQKRGVVTIDGGEIGTISQHWEQGAVTPEGTRTNTVFVVGRRKFYTMADAIDFIVEGRL